MPLLIVPGHDTLPTQDSINRMKNSRFQLNRPGKFNYQARTIKSGMTGRLCEGIVLASVDTVRRILITRDDEFMECRNAGRQEIYLSKTKEHPDGQFQIGSYKSPLWVPPVIENSLYAKIMQALITVLGNSTIIAVLQGYLLNMQNFDTYEAILSRPQINGATSLSREYLATHYPCGILTYPERVRPEFFDIKTGNCLLSINQNLSTNDYYGRYTFEQEPMLGKLTKDMSVDDIVERFKLTLMPILEEQMKTIIRI